MHDEEPTLLIIVGPIAVGKMTVGQEVARITGWPLFYNHLLIDLVTRFFPFQSPSFQRLTRGFTVPFFEEIAATRQSLIVTYGWAFDEPELVEVLLGYIRPVTEAGHRVCFAELEAPLEVRLERNLTENRRRNKNTDWATDAELRRLHAEHRWNSEGAFPLDMPHLVVDTMSRNPTECAEAIVRHFGFRLAGT